MFVLIVKQRLCCGDKFEYHVKRAITLVNGRKPNKNHEIARKNAMAGSPTLQSIKIASSYILFNYITGAGRT